MQSCKERGEGGGEMNQLQSNPKSEFNSVSVKVMRGTRGVRRYLRKQEQHNRNNPLDEAAGFLD